MDRGVTIVTGGASGIGLAIAKALLGEGWKLIIADLAQGPLDAARAELEPLRANATRCVIMDVADEASVLAALDGCETGFGPVRGLVNSAGIGRDVPFFDTSVALFRKILDVNLTGTFTVAREVGRLMLPHGGGAIVNIASVSGQRGNIGRSAYGASKGGVITLTQVMACELAPVGMPSRPGRSRRCWSRRCMTPWFAPAGSRQCRSAATPRLKRSPAPPCSCSTTASPASSPGTFSTSMAVLPRLGCCRRTRSFLRNFVGNST
jgi:NAD(P)-dependent dehydrogenase (short-subunit alcohol dehydrogenase family)